VSILEKLQNDLKVAMKQGDDVARATLRLSITALHNRRIELGEDLDEGEELAVLAKEVKKRQDAAEQYEKAGREDLARRERAEIEVVQRYVPRGLSEDETRELVRSTIDSLGLSSAKDIGRLMKALMAEHRGKVDGKVVQRLAREMLG
jgi:uncharacterized protein YqeY